MTPLFCIFLTSGTHFYGLFCHTIMFFSKNAQNTCIIPLIREPFLLDITIFWLDMGKKDNNYLEMINHQDIFVKVFIFE